LIKSLLRFCFVVWCNFAIGQNTESESALKMLDTVVVSANRSADLASKTSQEIKVLPKHFIKFQQAQTTADLLQSSGSVFVQKSQQGGGSPVLRGFEANRICLVIDGVRMNNAIYRGGHLQNVISIDNWSLEKVEVLQGPASTIYGSDALGGVVHFFNQKPQLANHKNGFLAKANTDLRYSSANNEQTGHLDFNLGNNKLASFTSLTYSKFGDLKSGKNQIFNPDLNFGKRNFYVERINGKDSSVKNRNPSLQVGSEYQQIDLVQRLIFKPDSSNEHGLNFQVSRTGDVPRYDRLSESNNGIPKFAEWFYGPQERVMLAYDYVHTGDLKKDDKVLHIGINHQWIEESRNTRNFGNSFLTNRREKIQVSGLHGSYKSKINRHTFRLGADFQSNFLVSRASKESVNTGEKQPQSTKYPEGNNEFYSAAGYVSHSLDLGSRFTLNDGLRLGITRLSSSFGNSDFYPFPFRRVEQNNFVYSGSVGLIYRPAQDAKIGFLVSTAFRSPNIDDLAKVFDSSPGNLIVPNPNLKPEKTITSEINFSIPVTKKLQWQSTGFYTQMRDAIVTDSFSFNGAGIVEYDGRSSQVFANQNQNRAFISGFSTNLNFQPLPFWSLEGNLTMTYGRIQKKNGNTPLDHIPPVFSRLAISYQKPKFRGMFYILHNGRKNIKDYLLNGEDNEAYAPSSGMPAWFTLNIRGQYKIHKNIQILAGIENLMDVQYRTFASGINGAGRNFSITLNASI